MSAFRGLSFSSEALGRKPQGPPAAVGLSAPPTPAHSDAGASAAAGARGAPRTAGASTPAHIPRGSPAGSMPARRKPGAKISAARGAGPAGPDAAAPVSDMDVDFVLGDAIPVNEPVSLGLDLAPSGPAGVTARTRPAPRLQAGGHATASGTQASPGASLADMKPADYDTPDHRCRSQVRHTPEHNDDPLTEASVEPPVLRRPTYDVERYNESCPDIAFVSG